ncbi:MAG: glycosyltransferase [Phycisphaerae bacterium]|nr:glycosyltransferase family 4 protein [Phycisphaerae bacterium]NIP54685.1 glycosyltransferase family 4 protein [Phycisphaerae bacterium]NIS53554.1 glycosyltransferase family 4 protein [Phycisphaerae bacterium]NIU11014.1 glycosyltransferase family 4 protein [Phycisphaerae bacterium]NIU58897.1 glycosyltransferase [Phycisphaerae bacterium]
MKVSRRSEKVLGIISAMYAYRHEGDLYIHSSFGRIIDTLAERYKEVILCIPTKKQRPDEPRDYRIQAGNVEVIPQPFYTSSLGSLKHPLEILRAYTHTCKKSDALFIRGLAPFVGLLYVHAWLRKNVVCHWIVGNPIALLKTHKRSGLIIDKLSLIYAHIHRLNTRAGRWLTKGAFVCNGTELAELYKSPCTIVAVSSSVKASEFFEREDTCGGKKVRILFVGFVRPEKGVEYLIKAVSKLVTEKEWELVIVGSRDGYSAYTEKLDKLVDDRNLRKQVRWVGYVKEVSQYFREADIFVLPTLSEGTPHVLVEARANSLPVISTNVGGIPDSVSHGYDGVLVPPKDSDALAHAIDHLISDKEFRQSLIRNGLSSARNFTIARFVDTVVDTVVDELKNRIR